MEFEKPIEIRVTPGSEPKVFESFDRFSGWAKEQLAAWNRFGRAWHANNPSSAMPNFILRVLLAQESEWNLAAQGNFRGGRDRSIPEYKQFEQSINQGLARHQLLALEQPLVERAFALAPVDPEAAGMVLLIASDVFVKVLEDSKSEEETLAHLARAVAYLSTIGAYDAALGDHLSAVEKISAGVLKNENDRVEMLEKSKEIFADFTNRSQASLENIKTKSEYIFGSAQSRLREIEDEWVKLRKTYDGMLKLSEPRKYWSSKLEIHERIFKRWRVAFFSSAAGFAVVLAFATSMFVIYGDRLSKDLGGQAWILPVMMLGVPAFMALWLLRMCGRQWQDHLSRCEDARERIVMVETFLALSREKDSPNKISDPAQLSVVLAAIFRAGPGFSTDDGPPAGVVDAVLMKLGAKN